MNKGFSAVAADDIGSERERKELDERFAQLRPEVLETLRKWIYSKGIQPVLIYSVVHVGANGHANHAFILAENYRDFRSLASLCHKSTTYPPDENPNATRIQLYIEKFKDEFTTELYQWYIEHGKLSLGLQRILLEKEGCFR